VAKILIVDDDRASAESIARELKVAGHVCGVLGSGKGLLEVAKKEAPDLLVLDVMLPDISGFEVCRQIRRDAELFTLPVLFVSAMANPEEVQHGLEQGADDYITKPFDVHLLSQRVNALLRMATSEDFIDPVTDLPDAEGTRKRIHQLISRSNTFALVYVEMLNLRAFATKHGEDARNKALRHLGRALHMYGDNFREKEFFVGHLGGGFFICAVPFDQAKGYCKKVRGGWSKHLKSFYGSLGIEDQFDSDGNAALGTVGSLDLIFCVTARDTNEPTSSQQLLDTLSRIRRTIGDVEVGGIHVDRRLG